MRYIISGGGTGGHIFPAISIARKIQELDKESRILFVGAKDRMEMQKVPQSGFSIVGLPIKGIDRTHKIRNVAVFFRLLYSLFLTWRIVKDFCPDVAIGVGGYASAATMKMAAWLHVPVIVQEQNSYAGVTNKLLRSDARYVCVAYDGMERFFPKNKIVLTGNPVREDLTKGDKGIGQQTFFPNRSTETPTLLIIGGSLGAKTINEAVMASLSYITQNNIQVIWQTGERYYDTCKREIEKLNSTNIWCGRFINDMPSAYAIADLVISRAGAGTISELCLLGKASLLVPSPNVAEDHQTHNAMALVQTNAAVMIKDIEAKTKLIPTALSILFDRKKIDELSYNISKFAYPSATVRIAELCIQLAKEKNV